MEGVVEKIAVKHEGPVNMSTTFEAQPMNQLNYSGTSAMMMGTEAVPRQIQPAVVRSNPGEQPSGRAPISSNRVSVPPNLIEYLARLAKESISMIPEVEIRKRNTDIFETLIRQLRENSRDL